MSVLPTCESIMIHFCNNKGIASWKKYVLYVNGYQNDKYLICVEVIHENKVPDYLYIGNDVELIRERLFFSFIAPEHFKGIWLSNRSIFSVPDQDYSRNASCALNLISTFLLNIELKIKPHGDIYCSMERWVILRQQYEFWTWKQ
jgi:hypothetical protein